MRKIIWQNSNGTYSHHKNGQCEFDSYEACAADLRFHAEWERASARF